ncbi:zinc transporter ZupT [Mycoplasma sp. P36-A1]|uniref:zinc transporter ZupT n=1 Tax=Mycoplasma sp. P36-A1 TaxID=3252900 RepID=UPI003C2F38A7
MFETHVVIQAFLMTMFAGLATGIGSLIALRAKTTNMKFLAASLGFSAGVMVYVSFVEILPEGVKNLVEFFDGKQGELFGVLAFFGGIAIAALIDFLVPNETNPHELVSPQEYEMYQSSSNAQMSAQEIEKAIGAHCAINTKEKKLMRVGMMSAIAIAIHNFPEGIATFVAGLSDPQLGISIAIAVAIHNIPEGIAASVPIYYATKDKKKAFKFSFLSGLAEPVGAIIAYFLLMPFLNDGLLGVVFCVIAGIMVYISIDELLPAAHEYGDHHLIIYGFIAGMAIMALSLVLI